MNERGARPVELAPITDGERESEFGDDLNHYALKTVIDNSILHGTLVTALCGTRFRVELHASGTRNGADLTCLPICVVCADLFAGLEA